MYRVDKSPYYQTRAKIKACNQHIWGYFAWVMGLVDSHSLHQVTSAHNSLLSSNPDQLHLYTLTLGSPCSLPHFLKICSSGSRPEDLFLILIDLSGLPVWR